MNLEAIYTRILERLAIVGLTPRAASIKAGLSADAIRNIKRGIETGSHGGVTVTTLAALAPVLETTVAWLLEGDDGASGQLPLPDKPETQPLDVELPGARSMPQNVPVWGTAMGSLIDDRFEGTEVFSTTAVDYVRRPPTLAAVMDAYALYITGDSMYPMHPSGALRFVHPHRPPRPGDSVVVLTKHWDTDPGQGYIKIFRRRTGDRLILEQLNPEATIEIPLKYVVSVHKVLDMNDLFGV